MFQRAVRYYLKQLKERDYVPTVVSLSLSTVAGSQHVLKGHLLSEQINEQMHFTGSRRVLSREWWISWWLTSGRLQNDTLLKVKKQGSPKTE